MTPTKIAPMLLSFALLAWTGHAAAADAPAKDAAPLTRAQVRMDTAEFLKTHTWDPVADNWVLSAGVEPPDGVKTRAEVRGQTQQFLRMNRWDSNSSTWIPLKNSPREVSSLSRAQVKAETQQFARTHTFDMVSQTWVDKPAAVRKAR